VFAKIQAPVAPVMPALSYTYNLAFGPFVELESGKPVDSQGAKLGPDQVKALGYVPGELPGFALPPPELTDLRILQGSCRG
jgi:hypothetical protein